MPDDNNGPLPEQCPGCGRPLDTEDAFCRHCGAMGHSRTLIGGRPGQGSPGDPIPRRAIIQSNPLNHFLGAALVISCVFAVFYWLNSERGWMQTYATFIGLPLIIGVLTVYLTRPREGFGMTVKITTVILCIVAPLLGEGSVCLLMAAPLFYGVALAGYAAVAGVAHLVHRRQSNKRPPIYCLALLVAPFAAAQFTATPSGLVHPATITVSDEGAIPAPSDRVWRALTSDNLVCRQFPPFLRLGFPLPTGITRHSDGLVRLTFNPGSESWPGTNVIVSRERLDLERRTVTFEILDDGTKLSRWLTFRQVRFEVRPEGPACRLHITTTFKQRMQPGFYWNPVEGYGIEQMHRYALESIRARAEDPSEPEDVQERGEAGR